jgi:8-oxo-dGTP pyrophosphatase MutT (NUDIX family)
MVKTERSAGTIIFCGNPPEFLILKNTVKKTFWSFPKGKIEEDETEQQAAVRETKEETNLDANLLPGFRYEQKWFYHLKGENIFKRAIFFLGEIPEEEKKNARISHEHEEMRWLPFEEAIKIVKIKDNLEMLKAANEFILNFRKQKKLF